MDLLNKTGVPIKNLGEELDFQEINNMNSSINNTVNVVNSNLMDYCNVNQEVKDYTRTFELSEAVKLVPKNRRSPGFKLKYLSSDNSYKEYIYCNTVVTDSDWEQKDNWKLSFNGIDGGEWEIENNI